MHCNLLKLLSISLSAFYLAGLINCGGSPDKMPIMIHKPGAPTGKGSNKPSRKTKENHVLVAVDNLLEARKLLQIAFDPEGTTQKDCLSLIKHNKPQYTRFTLRVSNCLQKGAQIRGKVAFEIAFPEGKNRKDGPPISIDPVSGLIDVIVQKSNQKSNQKGDHLFSRREQRIFGALRQEDRYSFNYENHYFNGPNERRRVDEWTIEISGQFLAKIYDWQKHNFALTYESSQSQIRITKTQWQLKKDRTQKRLKTTECTLIATSEITFIESACPRPMGSFTLECLETSGQPSQAELLLTSDGYQIDGRQLKPWSCPSNKKSILLETRQ